MIANKLSTGAVFLFPYKTFLKTQIPVVYSVSISAKMFSCLFYRLHFFLT
jgi:hypothetical protein